MGWLDITDEKLQLAYKKAWVENGRNPIGPHDNARLESLCSIYSKENNCSFTDAFIFAKTGKKLWL